jgi:hypothetical protein
MHFKHGSSGIQIRKPEAYRVADPDPGVQNELIIFFKVRLKKLPKTLSFDIFEVFNS